MTWIRTQLVPNLPPQSVLVIDNASYHNVAINRDPTTATLKKDMISWLVERNISHNATQTKPQLYHIIKQFKTKTPQYILDTELHKHGHRVLRLPPYHPELNPIEKMWAQVKQWVAAHNVTYKLNDVIDLAKTKFAAITTTEWEKVCLHVDKVVNNYIEKEHLLDNASDEFQFIVNAGDSDFSSEEEDDDENDDDETNMPGVSYLPQSDSD